ncbi:MAG: hypothetical protein KFH87_06780 [Bacteroidetes bacterium]|nr:hypothetical protein [Bacteroidota bacterium]
MKRSMTARVGGVEFLITRDETGTWCIDGEAVDVLRITERNGVFLRIGSKVYDVSTMRWEEHDKRYSVHLNGHHFSVEVEDERDALLKSYGDEKATKIHAAVIRSPMPGRIAKIFVREGELIEAGQGVLILEAMKMENEIKAPAAGIVKAVCVAEADAVEKNSVLIEIS